MASVTLQVHGMSCAGCAQSVERKLLTTAGVQAASVDLASATATITYDERATTPDSLEKVIEGLGFDVMYGTVEQEQH
jgi:copper chaperone CopZ